MLTRQEIIPLARSHADEAVDQKSAYEDAISAYHQNLMETLCEAGSGRDADAVSVADAAFADRLDELKVSHVLAGCGRCAA